MGNVLPKGYTTYMIPLEALKYELQMAMEDAVIGEIMRPSLIGRLRTIGRSILLRHGLNKSHIHVERQGNGFSIKVYLQQPGAIVREIWFSLQPM